MLQNMATTGFTDLVPGPTFVEFRKKAKRDDDAVEENRQLSADIWDRLPEHLMQEVLAKLPFSSLFRFCCVCKRWRDTILSGNPHLAFFYGGKLLILNPSRNAWESVPMSFLPVQRPVSLSLVASAGGLLCFRTRSFDEFLVCNPLTRSWKRLQMSWGEAPRKVLDPVYHTSSLRKFHRSKSMPKFSLVSMILNSDERHFKLIVASGVTCGQRRTLVYDSSSDCWEKGDGVPGDSGTEGSGGFHEAQTIAFRGNLYSTIRTTNDEMRLVKFDVQQRAWSFTPVPQMSSDLPWKLLEHNGKILLIAGNPRDPTGFEFYELKDSGNTISWPPFKSVPLVRLFEAMGRGFRVSENLKILECLGRGDSMFCIGSKFSNTKASLRSLVSSKLTLGITVGIHNFSTNSDVYAGWEEQVGGCQSFPRFWQIFRPSLLPCVAAGT